MSYFKFINKNLYDMYFKNEYCCSTQYDYFKLVYGWNKQAVQHMEMVEFNKYKTAYKWMNKIIPTSFFSDTERDEILLSDKIFSICYNHLRISLNHNDYDRLSSIMYIIIFESETNTELHFKWESSVFDFMSDVFFTYGAEKALASLLIFAETGRLEKPARKYELKNEFTYVKAFEKKVVDENLDLLIKDAIEINMAQICCPSLLSEYDDFFNKSTSDSIIRELKANPDFRINMVFMNPEFSGADLLVKSFMYGDSFGNSTKVIRDSINFAEELMKEFPNQIECKIVDMPMSYSIMQIKRKNDESIIKLDIYSPMKSSRERCSIIVESAENKDIYNLYSTNFYSMFNSPLSRNI